MRADDGLAHHGVAVEYYEQRASYPGTLLISEATFISEDGGGYTNVPGIFSGEQIAAWKRVRPDVLLSEGKLTLTMLDLTQVTDAVHAKGSFIYAQIWALGRAAVPAVLAESGNDHVAASAIPVSPDKPTPRALSTEEAEGYVLKFAQAARNAVEAGFDGVEIHGANGVSCV